MHRNTTLPHHDLPGSSARPICVVGGGYVGLVTAVCLADAGHHVRVLETDSGRLDLLRAGRPTIHEPGLGALLADVIADGRLVATDDVAEAMSEAAIAIIAVGTPPLADGSADLSQVRAAIGQVCDVAAADAVIAIKSTVPPGTTVSLANAARSRGLRLPFVACPEFLREGSAIEDFRHPARIVVGGDDEAACRRVAALFDGLPGERIVTDATSAEMIKYGSNAFLALKISFINEIAHLCELADADIESVVRGVGSDPRIGPAFLNAGLGFGGSCFPKDIRALEETASYHGHSFWMLKAAIEVNTQARRRFVTKIQDSLGGRVAGKRIAILGLAFKPGTDDMRQAASIDVIRRLQDLGARVQATDPAAMEAARPLLPGVTMVADPYACVADADAVALITEWPQLVNLDWSRVADLVKRQIVIDGRNALAGPALAELGFTYVSVGRARLRPVATLRRVLRAEAVA